MRGRYLFNFFYPFLWLMSLPLYLLPRAVVESLWVLLDLFPGKLGVALRYVFLLRVLKKVGANVFIGRNVEIVGWESLELGSNVSIHKDCYIDARGGLKVGDDVSVAHASSLLTFDHTWSDVDIPIRSNPLSFSSIVIQDDVWIGCGCRVLSGVVISTRSVVAAGAVVVKSVDSFSLVAGVPAKLVKRINR